MTPVPEPSLTWRRAHRTFWVLVAVAVVAAGFLSSAARAHPGPFSAVRVAISGTALILSVALAGRVFVHLERARRATQQTRTATLTTESPPQHQV
jgi:hypothetical protein